MGWSDVMFEFEFEFEFELSELSRWIAFWMERGRGICE